jgi:hypothetical protein
MARAAEADGPRHFDRGSRLGDTPAAPSIRALLQPAASTCSSEPPIPPQLYSLREEERPRPIQAIRRSVPRRSNLELPRSRCRPQPQYHRARRTRGPSAVQVVNRASAAARGSQATAGGRIISRATGVRLRKTPMPDLGGRPAGGPGRPERAERAHKLRLMGCAGPFRPVCGLPSTVTSAASISRAVRSLATTSARIRPKSARQYFQSAAKAHSGVYSCLTCAPAR